jgi:hypothetical protein
MCLIQHRAGTAPRTSRCPCRRRIGAHWITPSGRQDLNATIRPAPAGQSAWSRQYRWRDQLDTAAARLRLRLLSNRKMNHAGRVEENGPRPTATTARFHAAPPPRRHGTRGCHHLRCSTDTQRHQPAQRAQAPPRQSFGTARRTPPTRAGSHLESPLRPGRPVLTRSVSRRWRVSGLCPHRRLTERGAALTTAPLTHCRCQAEAKKP